tara:strand:+ start:847 stop:1431 length:585 start_codon:yes stop_codon:yes gene_type:complete
MSDLTITNAGVSVTPNSAGSSISTGKRKVIRVTPTCSTTTLTTGEVIFNAAEIPNAVKEDGGCSKLIHAYVIDYTGATNDFVTIFHETSGIDLGPTDSSSSANISEANTRLLKVTGMMASDSSDTDYSISAANIVHNLNAAALTTNTGSEGPIKMFPILLQAAEGSTSAYFSAITKTSETFAADSLEFIFHIEY